MPPGILIEMQDGLPAFFTDIACKSGRRHWPDTLLLSYPGSVRAYSTFMMGYGVEN